MKLNIFTKLWLALILLPLCGCAGLQAIGNDISTTFNVITGASISPNAVYVAANAFDAAEATATNYLKLPICPTATPVCKSQAGVNAIVPVIRSGRLARNQLEAYVNANPNAVVPVSGYDTLMTAVTTLQSLITEYSPGV